MPPSDSPELLSCNRCGTVAIGNGPVTCCEATMAPADSADPVTDPEVEDLLRHVFGMSDAELEICLCVMEGGPVSANDLAERTEYSRSAVSQHLNHLAALGVVEKQRRLIEQGGHVYVYLPVDPETVRQRLTVAFATWVRGATDRITALTRDKVASIPDGENPAWKLFREE